MVKKILTQLEKIAYWLQKKYMASKITNELVGPCFAFFHPEDKSDYILTIHQIRLAKIRNEKIVIVTGCFDILHQEHKKFLRKAKKEGDILIVGLESDQRIKSLKGEKRPINSWSERKQRLTLLEQISFIIKLPDNFNRREVRWRLLQLIKPDILAISGHDPLKNQKRKECQKFGCQVKIVHQYNTKISTTKMLLDKTEKII